MQKHEYIVKYDKICVNKKYILKNVKCILLTIN